jgi:hypothetical protein
MIKEAIDFSDQDPHHDDSFIRLFISWDDDTDPPSSTEVEVAITVHNIDNNKHAFCEAMIPHSSGEFEYVIAIGSGGPDEIHDQSLPIYNLPGTPRAVYAGFSRQPAASKANTVAL